jgi:hypothetical protein
MIANPPGFANIYSSFILSPSLICPVYHTFLPLNLQCSFIFPPSILSLVNILLLRCDLPLHTPPPSTWHRLIPERGLAIPWASLSAGCGSTVAPRPATGRWNTSLDSSCGLRIRDLMYTLQVGTQCFGFPFV